MYINVGAIRDVVSLPLQEPKHVDFPTCGNRRRRWPAHGQEVASPDPAAGSGLLAQRIRTIERDFYRRIVKAVERIKRFPACAVAGPIVVGLVCSNAGLEEIC